MEEHKLAACGIDCNICGQYRVTVYQDIEGAKQLVPWFRSRGWIGENEDAEAVMKRAPLCGGCWSGVGFCSQNCMRPCCEEKGINNCGECSEFPCPKYIIWLDGLEHHQQALEHLQTIHAALFPQGS
ncbi:MAG: DUF3795 domain-containing protein [Symbiobacteriaceae bacterium]|nr:DUF3795 domain-containing protein [Symbiobacteriaceae bacterium]